MSIPVLDGRFRLTAVVLAAVALPLACAVTCDDGKSPADDRAMGRLLVTFHRQVAEIDQQLRRLPPGDMTAARAAVDGAPTFAVRIVGGDVEVEQIAQGHGKHGRDRHTIFSNVTACYRVTGRPGQGVTEVPANVPCPDPLPRWAFDRGRVVEIPEPELAGSRCVSPPVGGPTPSPTCGGWPVDR